MEDYHAVRRPQSSCELTRISRIRRRQVRSPPRTRPSELSRMPGNTRRHNRSLHSRNSLATSPPSPRTGFAGQPLVLMEALAEHQPAPQRGSARTSRIGASDARKAHERDSRTKLVRMSDTAGEENNGAPHEAKTRERPQAMASTKPGAWPERNRRTTSSIEGQWDCAP